MKIERSGETIVTVVPDLISARFLIFTKARPPSIELRASYVDGPETAA